MDHDDAGIGRILSRRETLAMFGAAGVVLLGARPGAAASALRRAAGMPACIVRPEQTEGPYFVDEKLERIDIRSDPATNVLREGQRLDLRFEVSRMGGGQCQPLPEAIVDVWQCDAVGVYSDVRDTGGRFDTVGQKFLRGHQRTARDGTASFTTIYPGWYEGRTVHIHFKIRVPRSGGGAYDFTSQVYFDDRLTDRILAAQPYAARTGRRVRNNGDGIFRNGGDQLTLDVVESGSLLSATFGIGLVIP